MNVEAVYDTEEQFARPTSIYSALLLAYAAVHLSRGYTIADGFLPAVLIVAGCMQQTF